MSSWTDGCLSTDVGASSLAVVGQLSSSLNYSLHLEPIAGFSTSTCESSASLIATVICSCRPYFDCSKESF